MTKPPSEGTKVSPAPVAMAELVEILKAQPRTAPPRVRQPIEWPDRRVDRSMPPEK
jgi:hypothetical protein